MWTIPDSATRAAWFAAATQQEQLELLAAALGSAPRKVVLGASGELSLVTMAAPTINTGTTPRRLELGQVIPSTLVNTALGTMTSTEIRSAAGTVILRADAGVLGGTAETVEFFGAIKQRCAPSVGGTGIVVQANAALPAAPTPPDPLAQFQVTADGIWTWFTMPEAVQVGNFIYLGTVSSDGRCRAHRINLNTQATETFDLSGLLEIDDHNNASVFPRPDGSVVFFYGSHNDSEFKYRIWNGSGSFTSGASWTAEAARGLSQGPYSYPKPHTFPGDTTPGRLFLFHRRWTDGGGGTRTLTFRTTNTLTGSSDPWSAYTDVLLESGQRPYVVMWQDGNKLHCGLSSAQPNESTFLTINHCYAEMVGGALVWKRSDGATISGLPFAISDTTRADDGGNVKRWVSDIQTGPDGHPRILWMKYPGNDGTVIEYWHSRWTGSAWVAHKITDDGSGLYSAEPFYHGGLRFKRTDITRIFLSAPISGVRQVQEWSTSDNGATWAQLRVLTTGGSAANPLKARPIGVNNSDGRVNVMWWQGRYTSYTDYLTTVQAAG
jgi:hypothetical protein